MILVVPFKYYILPKRTHGSLSGFREFRCVIGGTSERQRAAPQKRALIFIGTAILSVKLAVSAPPSLLPLNINNGGLE